MEHLKLCESDLRFMQLVWEHEPINSSKLVELCSKKLGWKKSTTYTMIKKLCEKQFAKSENAIVTSLIPKEEVQAYESKYVVDHSFGGSLPSFICSFLGNSKLTKEEVLELKKLIDEYGGE